MTIPYTLAGMLICVAVAFVTEWRNRKKKYGYVALISPHYIQLSCLIVFMALTAHLIGLTTGVDWKETMGQ